MVETKIPPSPERMREFGIQLAPDNVYDKIDQLNDQLQKIIEGLPPIPKEKEILSPIPEEEL